MPSQISDTDRRHLAGAISRAERARVTASPNPGVGCLIVADGDVVGAGHTGVSGGPHAEIVALEAAGARARGATAYVTLSPCGHHGRTPPCADALVAAGIRRVVAALADPFPPAAGGLDTLRRAGVSVAVLDASSTLAGAVSSQLEGHLTAHALNRPHVTLKLAQTVEGSLVVDGRRWVTGPASRRAVHRMRANVDAVVVGSGTVLADDPRLDARAGDDTPLPGRQPRPVVFDSRLRTPCDATVVARRAVILTTASAPDRSRSALEDHGAQVHTIATIDGRVEPHAAMRHLLSLGITRVLAEPGHTLATTLLDAGLVDRLVLHVAAGNGAVRPALLPNDVSGWRRERLGGAGPDAVIVFARSATRPHRSQAA